MTPQRLIHLAELAEEAAHYTDNPAWARHLSAAAGDARRMADQEAQAELRVDLSRMLDEIKEAMGGWE